MIKFGAVLTTAWPEGNTQEEILDRAIAYSCEAEALGYESVWLFEHHFTRAGLCGSPLVMAAYIFGRTEHLRVGTSVCVVPLDHPIRLAEQVAMLDQLSKGRFDFGIGRGGFLNDFDVFGVDVSKNHLMLQEYMDLIRRAWSEDEVEANGQFVKFDRVPVNPKPRSAAGPSVYVAANSPSTIEWAAQNGFPMLLPHQMEDESKLAQLELYAESAAAAGVDIDSIEHALACVVSVADSEEEAESYLREKMAWWEETGAADSGLFDRKRRPDNYGFMFRNAENLAITAETTMRIVERTFRLNPIGTEAACADRLQELIDVTGITRFLLGFEGADSYDETLENMRRFIRGVAPLLREPVRAG